MELDRVATLLNRLSDKTKEKEIKWEKETNNSYATTLGKFKLSIIQDASSYDYEADPDYFLSITNGKNLISSEWIDSFSDEELKEIMPSSFKVMEALYREARRQANDVEGIVENLIKSIDGML
ncbi:hypothetical protein [Variovorax sp.]|uniref:hypothetical protein n=1 Tax=Variovorax sp. TaxID=1871043 RepID=UPI003BAD672E